MVSKLPIAKEGWPFIAIPGALALALALLGRRRLALPFAAAAAASAGFFRDPERAIPVVANGVLSPADGRVISIEDAVDPFVGASVRVAIFLSPLDVHVNRTPIAGVITDAIYTPGAFKPAYDKDADVNERCAVRIQGEHARVTVVQIAGVVARRIVCRVGPGDKLAAGERFGMIRFGSRTDCYMPRGTEVTVRAGEQVRGGQTVIGVLK
ncbi:MAG: phosphatidylserine decarboxylase family protein [Candidatus Rokuibacteriota bacterium]|nr:MAG: phosphatidylserine decarboxylase family protein [Candidatus Rokubacteria bacterium]